MLKNSWATSFQISPSYSKGIFLPLPPSLFPALHLVWKCLWQFSTAWYDDFELPVDPSRLLYKQGHQSTFGLSCVQFREAGRRLHEDIQYRGEERDGTRGKSDHLCISKLFFRTSCSRPVVHRPCNSLPNSRELQNMYFIFGLIFWKFFSK